LAVSQGEARQGLQASAHERLFHEGKPISLLHESGLASAAIAAVTLAAMLANAADLGPYGQGSAKDRYMPLPRVLTSSGAGPCYFRADVGYSWSNASA